MNEDFNYLIYYVPMKQHFALEREKKKFAKKRIELLKMYRISILSQFYINRLKQFDPSILLEILTPNTPTFSTYKIKSDIIKIISNLYMNLDILISILSKITNRNDYEYIIEVIIPSLFGFFSYDEQIQIAVIFYTQVIAMIEPKIAKIIIKPFFNSPLTYPFFESSFTEFFQRFTYDNQATMSIPSNINNSAQFLFDLFIKFIPLLPHEHISLLQILTRHFDRQDCDDFIINGFLLYNLKNWYRNKKSIKKEVFVKICDSFQTQKEKIDQFYSVILTNVKIYQRYKNYELPEVNFMINIKDFCSFANILENISLPIDSQTFSSIPESQRNCCLLCKMTIKLPAKHFQHYLFFQPKQKTKLQKNIRKNSRLRLTPNPSTNEIDEMDLNKKTVQVLKIDEIIHKNMNENYPKIKNSNEDSLINPEQNENEMKTAEYEKFLEVLIERGKLEKNGNIIDYLLSKANIWDQGFEQYVYTYLQNYLYEKASEFETTLDIFCDYPNIENDFNIAQKSALVSLPMLFFLEKSQLLSNLDLPDNYNIIKKQCFLVTIGKSLKKKDETLESILQPAIDLWTSALSLLPSRGFTDKIMTLACKLITAILSSIEDPLYTSLPVLQEALQIADEAGAINDAITLISTCLPSKQFIKLFLIVNAGPMRCSFYFSLLSLKEIMNWRSLERFILSSLPPDQISVFLNAQEKIFALFSIQ